MRNTIAIFPLFFLVTQLAAKPESWPVFPFQNGVHFKTVKERIKVLKELGYDGIGSAKLSQSDLSLPDRLKAYGQAGLKIFGKFFSIFLKNKKFLDLGLAPPGIFLAHFSFFGRVPKAK